MLLLCDPHLALFGGGVDEVISTAKAPYGIRKSIETL
jgi:hypothetical protein